MSAKYLPALALLSVQTYSITFSLKVRFLTSVLLYLVERSDQSELWVASFSSRISVRLSMLRAQTSRELLGWQISWTARPVVRSYAYAA